MRKWLTARPVTKAVLILLAAAIWLAGLADQLHDLRLAGEYVGGSLVLVAFAAMKC